ncbi:MAG: polysaccharide biosynthesis tyrosine autokinase [Sphaerobacter sp.]|nr:polysaccharide biosynthesis tyrosine autokinase [Sphaerobacter sp.]
MRELTFIDLVRLVRRWWGLFVLCPLLAGGVAYGVSQALPPIYRAQVTLVIDQWQTPGSVNVGDIQAAQELANTYSRVVTARPILEKTIAQLGLSTRPEDLIEQIEVDRVDTTQLVQIRVEDKVPSQAASIANTLAQVFIDEMRAQQEAAVGSGREELRRNIESVQRRMADTSDRIAALQGQADAGNSTAQAELRALQAQLAQDQALYASLLEAQQRMDLAAAQSTTPIRVVEPAVPPTTSVKPRILLNTALAGVLGVLLAAGLVLVIGYLDDTVKTSEDVQRLSGRGALGLIPPLTAPGSVEVIAHPMSIASEAFRSARTNLQFATIGQASGALVVTSPRPGDGKTTAAVNLAAVLAQSGQRVILVDADLRRPQVHRHFTGLDRRAGLSTLLLGQTTSLPPLLRHTTIPGLRILPSGPVPPNPADLLGSPQMRAVVERLVAEADIVIFDTPPLAVSDALVLCGLGTGVVLVAQAGRVRTAELAQAIQQIQQSGTPLLGVILNRVAVGATGRYYHYYRSAASEAACGVPAVANGTEQPVAIGTGGARLPGGRDPASRPAADAAPRPSITARSAPMRTRQGSPFRRSGTLDP